MAVFTVHMKGSAYDPAALERSVFVRDQFSWAALVFGPLWLLWQRLWLATIIWFAFELGIALWGSLSNATPGAVLALQALLHLALGWEASQLRRAKLKRSGYDLVGVVHGRRLADAERSFFLRTSTSPVSSTPEFEAPSVRSRSPEMIGLFPSSRSVAR